MRKLIAAIISLLLLISLAACAGNANNSVDVLTLKKHMVDENASLPSTDCAKSDDENGKNAFSYLCDIDYGKVGSYFFCYSASGGPEEIAVIRLKSASDVEEAKSAVKKHVETRKALFKEYDPEGAAFYEQALVFSDGNDVVLIVCSSPMAIRSAYAQAKNNGE